MAANLRLNTVHSRHLPQALILGWHAIFLRHWLRHSPPKENQRLMHTCHVIHKPDGGSGTCSYLHTFEPTSATSYLDGRSIRNMFILAHLPLTPSWPNFLSYLPHPSSSGKQTFRLHLSLPSSRKRRRAWRVHIARGLTGNNAIRVA